MGSWQETQTRPEDPFAAIAPHYDALMENVPYGAWADYVTELCTRAGRPIRPGSRLLDLATGTGSVALEFAARGCTVVGLDLSQAMLEQARRKAREREIPAEFVQADLADFRLPARFDHAVCLYDSLNYLLDPASFKRAFANIRAALKPDGVLVFDVNTIRALEAELFTQRSAPGAAIEYRWVSKYDPNTRLSVIRMDFRVRATGERIQVVHRQRGYTDGQIRAALRRAGFTHIAAYDAYRFEKPRPESDRVFYAARP